MHGPQEDSKHFLQGPSTQFFWIQRRQLFSGADILQAGKDLTRKTNNLEMKKAIKK